MIYMKDTTAIIIGAGLSSRMGEFKPLLDVGGISATERLIGTIQDVGVGRIVFVTGHGRDNVKGIIENCGVEEVYNEGYEDGMFSSIVAGLSAAARTSHPAGSGYWLFPVDIPLISAKTLSSIGEALEGSRFGVPTFYGKKGHPLFIPSQMRDEIIAYAENKENRGLKGITDRYEEEIEKIPVEDEGILLDMDRRQDYENLLRFCKEGFGIGKLHELAKGRRFILVRHGSTKEHREKIMLGQTDVPMDVEGRKQMKDVGEKLANMDIKTKHIYTSDLSRTVEAGDLIAEILEARGRKGLKIAKVMRTGLREIDLGIWDGEYISSIRNRYPEEYERRGENLFSYKSGHGGENFFDLQYRVLRDLIEILDGDGSEDVMLVAHSGVLRAMENNLIGKGVEDDWREIPKGGIRVLVT